MRRNVRSLTFGAASLLAVSAGLARASQVGEILVCYACSGTGNAAIDAALTSNPSVASDGILFAFVNMSASPITGGVFSVSNTSPADSFALPTIAPGTTFILMPGLTSDGDAHPSAGLFSSTPSGTKDTSDGAGGVSDTSVFAFTGLDNGLAVTSTTFGSSTGTPGTFTAGDPGLLQPYRSPIVSGSLVSFVGDGPSGDAGCDNCYFGEVATLNTPNSAVPEPQSWVLVLGGIGALVWISRRAATSL